MYPIKLKIGKFDQMNNVFQSTVFEISVEEPLATKGFLILFKLECKAKTLNGVKNLNKKNDRSSRPEVFLRKGVQKICS